MVTNKVAVVSSKGKARVRRSDVVIPFRAVKHVTTLAASSNRDSSTIQRLLVSIAASLREASGGEKLDIEINGRAVSRHRKESERIRACTTTLNQTILYS